MNDNVKTLGYLLKHYSDSQCYDQYVPLSWLVSKVHEEIKKYPTTTSSEWIENGSVKEFSGWLLDLLQENDK